MSEGRWSGGTANRQWQRPGSRRTGYPGDAQRGPRLARQMAAAVFWCETCNGTHPLAEHRACRDSHSIRRTV